MVPDTYSDELVEAVHTKTNTNYVTVKKKTPGKPVRHWHSFRAQTRRIMNPPGHAVSITPLYGLGRLGA